MTNAQITKRIAILEHQYNSLTLKAPLRVSSAIRVELASLRAMLAK